MKTYHGERTERGCEVTVNGDPLPHRSDLSGDATGAFDWGFIGTGHLAIAILADFLGDDPRAKAMCEAFEETVVAELPNRSWTLTGEDLTNALAPLDGVHGAVALNHGNALGAAFGDMPVETVTLTPRTHIAASKFFI